MFIKYTKYISRWNKWKYRIKNKYKRSKYNNIYLENYDLITQILMDATRQINAMNNRV